MKWCAALLVVCTGCLQPNPSFKPGSTSGGSETASEEDTVADIGTTPSSGDDDDGSVTTEDSSAGPTSDPTTTVDPTTDDGGDGTSTSTTGVALEHTIFVSSQDVSGDFGGFAGADGLCTELATAAGLDGDTWVAILSDSTIDARDHVVVHGPIRNVLGDLIAENQADLWDGFIGAPVQYTELGREFLASPFTGTQADGTATGTACNDWTTAGGSSGSVGDAGYAGSSWIEAGSAGCGNSSPLYCISQ